MYLYQIVVQTSCDRDKFGRLLELLLAAARYPSKFSDINAVHTLDPSGRSIDSIRVFINRDRTADSFRMIMSDESLEFVLSAEKGVLFFYIAVQ